MIEGGTVDAQEKEKEKKIKKGNKPNAQGVVHHKNNIMLVDLQPAGIITAVAQIGCLGFFLRIAILEQFLQNLLLTPFILARCAIILQIYRNRQVYLIWILLFILIFAVRIKHCEKLLSRYFRKQSNIEKRVSLEAPFP